MTLFKQIDVFMGNVSFLRKHRGLHYKKNRVMEKELCSLEESGVNE